MNIVANYWLKWLAGGWFLLISILFFLPGSSLPKEGWFTAIPLFDKVVHIGLFLVMIFLYRCAFPYGMNNRNLIIVSICYGLSVEIIQGLWIPGRSFDLFDLLADTIGSVVGLFIALKLIEKNKPL